ncbi:hypothetical protein B0H13DRAFT_2229264 [Mycena leptocephala]|nr:hypothetical protein B0H13DRAFT_2229264 [Mycena leptocephala]
MSIDPYHAVQREISSSLQAAAQLRASYVRIRNMAVRDDNEELYGQETRRVAVVLQELSMNGTAQIVESTMHECSGWTTWRFQERRRYVVYVRKEIDNMRAEVTSSAPRPASRPHSPYPERAWAREEQQFMIQEQDRTMESIAGTLSTLAQQAGLMGQEIGEHNEMLDDLERGVDQTDTKLSDAMRRMRKFLRQSEEKGSGWCIIILIIVLTILLLLIIIM